MLSSDSRKQIVLYDQSIKGGHPVFLDIGDAQPVSLFGGHYHSAAISDKGEIIFINRDAVKKSPKSRISSICLPDEEKAVSVACCDDSVVALSSNGRVFSSEVQSDSCILKFSSVAELTNQEIICMSGTNQYFLAVNKEGRVFGRGFNDYGQLGLGQKTKKVLTFTEISSLNKYKIRAAYAGDWHSLFETYEGKIIACGYNEYSQLLLNSNTQEIVYTPIETSITNSATFCIAGEYLSVVFIGGEPPNRSIQNYE